MSIKGRSRRNQQQSESDRPVGDRLRDGDVVPNPGHQRFAEILSEPTRVLPTDEPLLTRGQSARSRQPQDAGRQRAAERELWEIVAEIRRVSGRNVSVRSYRAVDGSRQYEFLDRLCTDAESARSHAFNLLLKVLDGRPWPPRHSVWA